MVQIYVQLGKDGKTQLPEWLIIELQGDLETKTENTSLSGKFVGDLHFTPKGIPVLIIGHHILYGKETSMERPFLVMSKSQPSRLDNSKGSDHMDTESEGTDAKYSVTAVIKKKLIFKTRPKPIITNVAKKI